MIRALFGVVGFIPKKVRRMLGLLMLLTIVSGGLYWKYLHMKHDLQLCGKELSLAKVELRSKEADVLRLRASVREQNEQVIVLREITNLRQQSIDEARNEIRQIREQESSAIKQLEIAQGSSCTDGIDLLNRELGL